MSAVRQIGIKMVVDAQSVTTEMPRVDRAFDSMASRAEQGAARTTRSLAQVSMSMRDIVQGAAGLHVVGGALNKITEAIRALPRSAFNYSKELEVSQVGMAGILGSMTAMNGQQLQYNQALKISSEYIQKLNDDALRTAASSQELTGVFQALLAPGVSAKMTLEEIRQLTVVGTNAVKSMGLSGSQVVQELRDLVAGGITAAGSQLATALGLKDSDIAAAKASSEGLFKFLMDRLQGFKASSEAFGDTLQGKLDQVKEGATRVAAQGFEPLITASKTALDEVSRMFVTIEGSDVKLNDGLVNSIREVSEAAVRGMTVARDFSVAVWENRDAVMALGAAWAAYKVGDIVASTVAVTAAKLEATQASRLLTIQEAAESAGNAQVVVSSKAKIAAYLAELETNAARAQAEVVNQTAQIATLRTTQEAIVVARAEVVAKMEATRATMAQAEAQIVAARAAGAQSMALALVREGTQALTAAQARHAVLMTELATLGRQQAGVQASITAATAAQTVAQDAATASATKLVAAQGAASIAGRALGGVLTLMGGWVGLVTTALTLGATAWAVWGNAGSSAEAKVQGAVERSTPDIIADLDKQIAKLRERNSLVAAGLGDIAKQGGEAADRLGKLQTQINNLQAGKGLDGGAALPEEARSALLGTLTRQYGELYGRIQQVNQAQKGADASTGQLTLTVSGAEQAWRKSIDGVKTASAIQQDYNDKLSASQKSFAQFEKVAKASPNFDPAKLKAAQAEQAQAEKALADERDKQIKSLSAGSASARSHGIDAEISATKHGYKLLAAQTADSLAEVDSLRKQGLISDSDALERRTTLQLADIDAQRAALQSEMSLLKGRKDSVKKQADVIGELAELEQKRANIEAAAARQQRELDAEAAAEMDRRVDGYRTAANQALENLRTAKLDQAEIGKTGAALGVLRQARVEEMAVALERKAVTMDGIDLSGQASKALRDEAAAVRDLAKVQGYNESAKMVAEYTRSVQEANDAVRLEMSLTSMSQRDRDIALEQYRIAIDLKQKLAEIDAKNPADKAGAAKLKADATAAAEQAQAAAANRVYVREWAQSVNQYDDVFRKGFADMLNKGESEWKSFTTSLSTTFKTTVADQLYKAFAQPIVVRVVGQLLGVTGSGAMATAGNAGANMGGASSILNGGMNGSLMDWSTWGSKGSGWLMGQGMDLVTKGWETAGSSLMSLGQTVQGVDTWLKDIPGMSGGIGSAAGYLGSLVALSKGQYGTAIGSAIGTAIMPGIGTMVGGFLGGLANGIFGGSVEQTGSGIAGRLGGTVRSYADFEKDGGWFGSDRSWTEYAALAADDQLQATFKTLQAGIGDQAKALGQSSDAVKKYTREIRFSTQGLSGDQVAARLQEEMAAAGNAMAALVLGTDKYTLAGETASATLQRMSTSLTVTNTSLDAMGGKLFEVGLAGADMASKLVANFGSVDAYITASEAYYKTYYSQAERANNSTAAMSKQLAELGLTLPGTQTEFRALVSSLDLTTEHGRKAYAMLVQMAPQFDETAKMLDELAKAAAADLIATYTRAAAVAPGMQIARDAMSGTTSQAQTLGGSMSSINKILGDANSGVLTWGGSTATATTQLTSAQKAMLGLSDSSKVTVGDLTATQRAVLGISTVSATATTQLTAAQKALLGLSDTSKITVGDLTAAQKAVLGIGTVSASSATQLTAAQQAVFGLRSEIFDLQAAASGTVLNIDGLAKALQGVDTRTWTATITSAFELIAKRVRDDLSSIATERSAVREAAISIIGPSVMTPAQIRAQIAKQTVSLPNQNGIAAAQVALAAADKRVASAQTSLATANSRTIDWEASRRAQIAQAQASITNVVDVEWYKLQRPDVVNSVLGRDGKYQYHYDKFAKAEGRSANQSDLNARNLIKRLEAELAAGVPASLRNQISSAQAELAAAQAAQAAATDRAKNSQLDYVAALQKYSLDSGKAVSNLSKLREETVAYYQSQAQLAQAMQASAGGLRQTVADIRFGMMDSGAQFANLQERFNVAYSMAMVTQGETLAGYGNEMNSLLNPLLQKAQEAGIGGAAYSSLVNTLLARAEAIAGRIEKDAPKNYQEESLGLLGQIDSTLAALEAGAKSSDQVLTEAIKAGTDVNRDGLRAVIAALQGRPVPAFALGGDHVGGWRLVGERGPELEATGPARYFTADQTQRMLSGPPAMAGLDIAPLVRELQELRRIVEILSADRRADGGAIAANTGRMLRLLDRLSVEGIPVRNAEGERFTVYMEAV